ncbi:MULTISPECIES: TetR/AcrR family transcriptional regulator [unclassified Pseudodesulfovibrio]|uniref:TetR/AcrR family transcriptional regulator n=1 Tax=unclassified Pseudodesulfovibrio TaxID=2661612 RepID=UPI000FEBDE34|nr:MULTISPECIES: TetR/AcrR family transcriptional regulator [unclassified Pseudodesulfovibrio]MCJ2164211.1 TetR/AcrR family transcriptional regulator [Pseudodesulfovibrio sp. S3-i]RWU05165.1 TetR/AcrR family transcriptional regulator [Pseudodesulfovibrio sp. S3]
MKISAGKKTENRRAILEAAVDLLIESGFKSMSMRAVARKAGVGDATIYSYFPTKDALIYGYYEESLEGAVRSMAEIDDFERFDLREKLQLLFETILEGYLADREFVSETFSSVFFRPVPGGKGVRAIRSRFLEIVREQFDIATEAGELPDIILKDLVYQCIWDYFIATILYWLKDDSEQFSNTTLFIDKSLDLGYVMLKSGVLDKVTGLASFLFKSHVLSRIEMIMDERDTFSRIKEEFMSHDAT